MADNIAVTAGSGHTVALDEVTDATLGSCKVQYVKLMSGTLDSTEKIEGTAANGLEVDVTRLPRSATPTTTTVADNAASTTILASNANRLGATVANDSSAVLYLLLGSGTASATNYTVRMVQYGYYEVPFGYTGQLTGIWATDPGDGAARITEIT